MLTDANVVLQRTVNDQAARLARITDADPIVRAWTQKYNCRHRDRDGIVCRVCADTEIAILEHEVRDLRASVKTLEDQRYSVQVLLAAMCGEDVQFARGYSIVAMATMLKDRAKAAEAHLEAQTVALREYVASWRAKARGASRASTRHGNLGHESAAEAWGKKAEAYNLCADEVDASLPRPKDLHDVQDR